MQALRLIAMLVRAFGIGPRARHSQTQPLTFHSLPSCPRKGEYVIDGKKLSDIDSPRAQEHGLSCMSLLEIELNQAGRRHMSVII